MSAPAADEAGRSDIADIDHVMLLDEVEGELVLPVWEPRGEPGVDGALDLLAQLDELDLSQHAEVFDQVHERLRTTLSDLDLIAP